MTDGGGPALGSGKSEGPSADRLAINSVWNVASYAAAAAAGFVCVPFYLHALGPRHYGLMVLLYSILVPLGLLNLGFGQATIKFVAESLGRGAREEAATYVSTTLLFNIAVGIVGAVVLALLASLLSTHVFKIAPADQHLARTAFYWVALGWLGIQISATYTGVPMAMQRYNLVAIGNSVAATSGLLVGLAALLLGGDLLTVIEARVLWSFAVAGAWAIAARRLLPGLPLMPGWHRAAFRRSFRFGSWQTLASVGGILANQTDPYLLGAYVSTTAVALYNIAILVQQTVYGAIYQLAQVLFPAMSTMQGEGNSKRAEQLMLRSGWLLSVLTIVALAPLAVFAHDFLRLYVGHAVAARAAWLLQVFAVAGICSSGSVAVAQYLLGTGSMKWFTAQSIASGLIILTMGLILVPRYGLVGAGWSQIVAIVISRPLIQAFMRRSLFGNRVPASAFFSFLYGPPVVGSAFVLLLVFIRNHLALSLNWVQLGAGAIVISAATLGAILCADFAIPDHERRAQDLAALLRLMLLQINSTRRRLSRLPYRPYA